MGSKLIRLNFSISRKVIWRHVSIVSDQRVAVVSKLAGGGIIPIRILTQ
jgi:hypothetical protein